jgi:hypothetical protein
MQQRQLRLGDILDDYCPRERRVTNHAIVAMIGEDVKQTRCTTCDTEHQYKHAKVPRQRRKSDTPAALYAQIATSAPKRVAHESMSNGPAASVGPDSAGAPDRSEGPGSMSTLSIANADGGESSLAADSAAAAGSVNTRCDGTTPDHGDRDESEREAGGEDAAPGALARHGETPDRVQDGATHRGEPSLPIAAMPVQMEPDDNGENREDEEGPVHRPLIRASLPRHEGQQPPQRPLPEFTIRQPGGRPHRFRPRHQHGGGGPSGQHFHGNRPNGGAGGSMRGPRPGSGRPGVIKRHGPPGRKRSK